MAIMNRKCNGIGYGDKTLWEWKRYARKWNGIGYGGQTFWEEAREAKIQ